MTCKCRLLDFLDRFSRGAILFFYKAPRRNRQTNPEVVQKPFVLILSGIFTPLSIFRVEIYFLISTRKRPFPTLKPFFSSERFLCLKCSNFPGRNPEKDLKSRSRKIAILIISRRYFDFRLVKNRFRFLAMKSKYEMFDFKFVRFRKPLKNPVETSFSVLLLIFYLSLEYLWFWNIYTLVFLSLFLLAQNFLVERGDEK